MNKFYSWSFHIIFFKYIKTVGKIKEHGGKGKGLRVAGCPAVRDFPLGVKHLAPTGWGFRVLPKVPKGYQWCIPTGLWTFGGCGRRRKFRGAGFFGYRSSGNGRESDWVNWDEMQVSSYRVSCCAGCFLMLLFYCLKNIKSAISTFLKSLSAVINGILSHNEVATIMLSGSFNE